jgi:hypothetical protein
MSLKTKAIIFRHCIQRLVFLMEANCDLSTVRIEEHEI